MNKRIKLFTEQAGDHADTKVNTHECDSCGECEHCIDWYDVYNSKFAELIVRECSKFINVEMSLGGVDGRSLLEYFGVEE